MIIVLDRFTDNPIVQANHKLPLPGLYYSIIEDAYMAIITPFYKDEDTCFVVKYKLVHAETLEESTLTETYYPYRNGQRSSNFFNYLAKHFSARYNEDEAIIGLREKVEINWDVLGGFAYPIISRRWFIDLPEAYKENYLNEGNEEDED